MNLNANLSDINPKELLATLQRSSKTIVTLIIIGLIGFTGYRISQITAVQPDQAYMQSQKDADSVTSLKVNKDTINQIKSLQSSGDTSVPINPGKYNPFTPN